MRRLLFAVFVIVFVFGITAGFAWGDSCCSKAKAAGGDKETAAHVKGAKAEAHCKGESKGKHGCPDVSGRADLKGFHDAMHPMHMTLKAKDFEGLNKWLPDLLKASQALVDYKCEGYEKCSKPCKKSFDGQKAELLQSIDMLAEACKGKDNEKITSNFDVMHEAYISYASTCVHAEKAEKVEKAEAK